MSVSCGRVCPGSSRCLGTGRGLVKGGWWVWMVVRFVCVIRVPVSRVCPGSPRSLFTGRWKRGGKCVKDSSRMRGVILV